LDAFYHINSRSVFNLIKKEVDLCFHLAKFVAFLHEYVGVMDNKGTLFDCFNVPKLAFQLVEDLIMKAQVVFLLVLESLSVALACLFF